MMPPGRLDALKVRSVRELLDDPPKPLRKIWGKWKYHSENFTLVYRESSPGTICDYEIDLEECRTSANVLDYIFSILDNWFGPPKGMVDLLDALQDLLNPPENLCSFGENKTIDPVAILKNRGTVAGR